MVLFFHNRLVLKGEVYSAVKGTLGLFAPDPNQGVEPPGPTIGEITMLRLTNNLRQIRWGYEKYESFWPKKARENPKRK